jgi:hypothetical protein
MMPLPNSHLIGFCDEPGSHEPDGNRRPPATPGRGRPTVVAGFELSDSYAAH